MKCPNCLGADVWEGRDHFWCHTCGESWAAKGRRPVVAFLVAVVCIAAVAVVGAVLLASVWSGR